ncbi:autotransporter outer membrane beta-barrel domain-containing protein [Variovorax sp. H27-G14]|uniref:autotransporter outer membrane beta-barrel domain-containing protein n=1 Tax=Variovorax sp. H27-G14 TaxID=3111914 RepID=UPI0038FCD823
MNKTFRTLWNPTRSTWVATPEISRGHARSSSRSSCGTRAVAMAVALVCAGPALAAGGAGGQPVGEPMLHAGAGGSDGNGGSGGLNDSNAGASGGNGGASTPAGVVAGSDAVRGSFLAATPGTGGAAGAAITIVSPGVFQGDSGTAGQAQTGGFGAGDGYGGGGGGGFQGASIATNATSSTDSYTGGNGGAGGQGYWAAGGGGAGGYGAILNGALVSYTSSGPATGGVGGAGGDAFSQGGGGGSGGGGFYLNAAAQGLTFTNLCMITGGAGGAGGAGGTTLTPAQLNASGGGGGAGGIGLTLAGSAITVNNVGRILGGAGGVGGDGGGGATGNGAPGAGGDGGTGLSSQGGGGAVNNTGTIAGGAGGASGLNTTGGAAGATGAGGVGVLGSNLAVTNSGTIAGGLGGDGATLASAVEFTAGSNSFTLQTGAVLTGAIAIDTGATASVIAGSDGLTVGNALLLGGTGTIDTQGNNLRWTGPISGAADLIKAGAGVLTVSGANTNSGATSVAAGTLRAGALNTFSSASAFNVASGATLDLAGFNQAVASVANSGTVSLVGTVPGTTLTVTGPWVGNGGTLRLGTALGDSTSVSDRLVLSGATAIASGTTNVQIVNLGGLGGLTAGNGIEVISAINGATTTAQTTRSAFNLAGGHVDAGAYQYRLYAADASGTGENWYLRSTTTITPPGGGTGTGTDPGTPVGAGTGTGTGIGAGSATGFGGIVVPTYRNEVALYAALPEQVRQAGLAMLGNLHQRVGDDGASGTNTASPEQGYRQAWGRIISTDRTIGQSGTVSPTSEGRLTGFQAGTDLWADPNWRVGVYVGQLDGTMSVTGFAGGLQNYGVGSTDLRNQFLGAYATWKNDTGLYVDGVLQAGRHRYTASPTLGFGSSGKGNSLLASIEVGQSFPLAENWRIEPQLQLVHQRVNLDDNGIVGALVQQNPHNGWLLRAGVRVKGEIATGAGLLQPYVRVNVYRSGSGSDATRFVGPAAYTDIATVTGGTSTELAGGATLSLTPSTSLYAELGKLWSSSGDARIKSGVNASVGVKVRW